MIQFMMNIMLLIFMLIFTQLKHPLAMGFLLLIQTFLICFLTGIMSESFWFSYILFLVFLGGMLILFIYVTSLASNEMFNLSFKLFLLTMFMLTLSLFLLMLIKNFMELSNMINTEIFNNDLNLMFNEMYKSIYKIYNFPMNWMTCFLINYLFLTLIVSVKITNFFYGPLRNLN